MKIDGRCHCGYVSFEAEANPETTTICNCTDCQMMSGATSDGDDPKAYNVRVGVVRQRYELVPRKQLFVCSQQAWVNNLNSIPKFDKMPTPSR